jgi:mannose-6-phosphate isomerase
MTDPRLRAIRQPLPLPYHPVYRGYRGGRLTQQFRDVAAPEDTDWPEDWVGSTTIAGNRDPDGRQQGLTEVEIEGLGTVTLADLVTAFPEEMVGTRFAHRFGPTTGVLVKLNSPAGPAPLHGHPDRDFAARHLGSPLGKAEAWIMLETPGTAAEPPYAAFGVREGAGEADFRRAMDAEDSAALRELLHRVEVAPGDVWLMHHRVPHCLGPGLSFLEVQEPSDHIVIPEWWAVGADEASATMGLGWELAFQMLDLEPSPRERAVGRARQSASLLRARGASVQQRLVDESALPFFDVHRLNVTDDLPIEDGRFSIDVVVDGDGFIEGDFARQPIRRGAAFAAAASLAHRFVAGTQPLHVIRCMGPLASQAADVEARGRAGELR